MNTWQPIETAPRDGTEVLANDTSGIGSRVVVAKYLAGDEWSGWIYDDDMLTDCNPLGPRPSHWMPLPPPPEEA